SRRDQRPRESEKENILCRSHRRTAFQSRRHRQAQTEKHDRLQYRWQACTPYRYPFKVTGAHTYVQDLRLPDMVHGRPVRPPAFGATLVAVEESSVKDVPGLIKVVAKGNFVGVVCEREEQAIRAARDLKVTWRGSQVLPPMSELHAALRR